MSIQKCIVSLLVLGGVQQAMAQGLFISEYNEPVGSSGNRKVIEVFNNSGADVDLTTTVVKLLKGTNGGAYSSDVTLGPGTLCNGDTYVIANGTGDNSGNPYPDVDQVEPSGVFFYNGDDPLALEVDGTIVDVIGVIGPDPGSGWDVAGVSGGTANNTMRRKASVTMGNTDWAASAGTDAASSEWEVLASNTFDDFGFPEATCAGNEPPAVDNVMQDPLYPNQDDVVSVMADLSDTDGMVVSGAVNWGLDPGMLDNMIPMSLSGGMTWASDMPIPEFDECTQIFFSVSATDDGGATVSSPVQSYTVECEATVSEIQGLGDDSPFDGLQVLTSGTVQRVYEDRFSIQTGTSARMGVIVYTGSVPTVVVGDLVSVRADVDEYFDLTELTNVAEVMVLSSGVPYPPVVLSSNDANGEDWEGMLVTVESALVTVEPNNFGEFQIDDGSGEVQVDNGEYDGMLEPLMGECFTFTGVMWYNFGAHTIFPQYDNADALPCPSASTEDLVGSFELAQNFPNPFNPATTISFNAAELGEVSLHVYDLTGAVVATLVNGTVEAGKHSVVFDASRLSSGVYFYTLKAADFTQTRKMVLVK